MCRGMDVCQKKMREIIAKDKEASAVEQDMLTTLEVCYEFYLRGFTFRRMDIYQSDASTSRWTWRTTPHPALCVGGGPGRDGGHFSGGAAQGKAVYLH